MKNIVQLFIFMQCAVFFFQEKAAANNVQLSGAILTGMNTAAGVNNPANYTHIQFSVSWENSWRNDIAGAGQGAPFNYDAVWIFAKYRTGEGPWLHATLDDQAGNHTLPAGGSVSPSSDGKGVFLFRSANGSGSFSLDEVRLRWNYGTDGVTDDAEVDIRLFAVEMVYIPSGAFYAGDGQTDAAQLYGNFESGTSGLPLHITSESQLTLGGSDAGSLGNNNRTNQFANGLGGGTFDCSGDGCLSGSGDDFTDVITQTLPAAFPKGFNAFYIMKYEMTQQQFVDMLNTLTAAQCTTYLTQTGNFFFTGSLHDNRYTITESGGIYSTTTPNVPMIFFDWVKAAAFADWAGLRPMTELEFEKAARGGSTPVLNEYAWGNANLDLSDNLVLENTDAANEGIASGFDAGGVNGNAWIRTGNQTMSNVARVGIFSAHPSNSGRISSGASYWGVMEFTGNAWERAVSVGHAEGRKFTGTHGDGLLTAEGYANRADWPGTFAGGVVNTNVGVGYRGGGLAYPNPNLETNGRISSRRLASGYWNVVINDDGARFVRTAE